MTVTLKGVDKFASHVNRVASQAPHRDVEMVKHIAGRAKTIVVATASPKRLSRANRGKGVTLKARYTDPTGKPPTSKVVPVPPGLWSLMQSGGKAHTIGRRGNRRRGGAGFLGRPGVFAATGPVQHPATAGKGTWSRSEKAALAASRAAFVTAYKKQYVDLFKG